MIPTLARRKSGRRLWANTLAATGYGGSALLWKGILWRDLADLKVLVCDLVVGNLTRAEWDALAPGLAYSTTCPS